MSVDRIAGQSTSSVVDILDRVLDKGLAVAADIRISIADVRTPQNPHPADPLTNFLKDTDERCPLNG